MRITIPEYYWKFKSQFPDLIPLFDTSIELFGESNIEFEQTNSAIAREVEFTNHERFNPEKHLFIGAGIINEPWFIDTTDHNPKIYICVPGSEDGIWKASCIANSLEDLATILQNLIELDKELRINPTWEMLRLYWVNIQEAVGDADLEYWELYYAEGEWWVKHGPPDE